MDHKEVIVEGNSFKVPRTGAYHVVEPNKNERYIVDGYLHRDDGPAFIWHYKEEHPPMLQYYRYGNKHRIDGPAVEYYNLTRCRKAYEYWIDGKRMTYEQWEKERKRWIEKEKCSSIKSQII